MCSSTTQGIIFEQRPWACRGGEAWAYGTSDTRRHTTAVAGWDRHSRRSGTIMILAVYTLWLREVVRFYRQRSRIIGALGSPLVFWLLIGSGLGRSFDAPGIRMDGGYLEYFYPGTLALIILFTAVFSTISIIEDRQEGFLQGVLVAPVPGSAIVLGKVLGGTTLAFLQAALFLVLAPFAQVEVRPQALPMIAGFILVLSVGLTGLGFVIAWTFRSAQGFHAIMNIILIPMWMLSGALFPAAGAAEWVRALMWVNPLTYGVSGLRTAFYGQPLPGEPSLALSFLVICAFGAIMLVAGSVAVRRSPSDGRV
jgi:ABC-2 type transport system permease protein